MNRNFGFLNEIKDAMGRNVDNPKELARLELAKADVLSRLTKEQIVEYTNSLVPTELDVARAKAKHAEELKEMEFNRDSNSI